MSARRLVSASTTATNRSITGVIVNSEGYVITNTHVVQGADDVGVGDGLVKKGRRQRFRIFPSPDLRQDLIGTHAGKTNIFFGDGGSTSDRLKHTG